jgi:hypothetical protein
MFRIDIMIMMVEWMNVDGRVRVGRHGDGLRGKNGTLVNFTLHNYQTPFVLFTTMASLWPLSST